MKAKPYKWDGHAYHPCEPSEATHVKLHPPGPYPTRMLPIEGKHSWGWNRDTEKPTITPSILTQGGNSLPRCHSYVTDGRIQFLQDCGHELAGKTVDLLDIEG